MENLDPFSLEEPVAWRFCFDPVTDINYFSSASLPFPGRTLPAFSSQDMFSQASNSQSPTLPPLSNILAPQYIQPSALHVKTLPTPSSSSSPCSPPSTRHDVPPVTDPSRQLPGVSNLPASTANEDIYHPRSSPIRTRRTPHARITPRSSKHARELEQNRKAATKCRKRQKQAVEELQDRCRLEEEKLARNIEVVRGLTDQVALLRVQAMGIRGCACSAGWRPGGRSAGWEPMEPGGRRGGATR